MALNRRQIISLSALAIVLAVSAYYVVSHLDRFAVILRVPPAGVAAIAALVLLGCYARSVVLRLGMAHLGTPISTLESNLLVWASFYWNYLPMRPGLFAQAVHMKLRRGLPYGRFAAYLLASNLVGIFIRSVLGLAFTVPLVLQGRLTPVIAAVFAAAALACCAVMAVPVRWTYSGRRRILRGLSLVVKAWRELRGAAGLLVRIGLWSVAQLVVATAQVYLCLRYVGVDHALPQALVYTLLSPLTAATAFVPGNLGINEVLFGLVVMAFGGTLADGVVAATLARAVRFGTALIFGSYASHRLLSSAASGQSGGAAPAQEDV